MRQILLYLLFAMTLPQAAMATERSVVIISIDGLMPEKVVDAEAVGLELPTLTGLMNDGAWARVIGVLPSVTYPSHTTLITGVPPAIHGIDSNTAFDPLGTSGGAWRWYASEVDVLSLVSAAEAKGLRTASAWWPVSVGMNADLMVPEFWRSRHDSDRYLLELLSTPNLLDQIGAWRGSPFPAPHGVTDRDRTDIARFMIESFQPNLLLLHLIAVDSASHRHGHDSPEAHDAIREADAHVGEILESLGRAGMAETTTVMVVSDHGFIRTGHQLKPNLILADAGLIDVDEEGRVTDWRAWFQTDAGLAMLRLADDAAPDTLNRVRARFEELQQQAPVFHAILEEKVIRELGADSPLALDAADGYKFDPGVSGEWIEPENGRATHGYDPRRKDIHASFIANGPAPLCGDLGVISMTQIAPTAAAILDLQLDPRAGTPLQLERPCDVYLGHYHSPFGTSIPVRRLRTQ